MWSLTIYDTTITYPMIRKKRPSKSLQTLSRMGSNQTATRCIVIQMLLSGADPGLVYNALAITRYRLRK